MSKRNSYFSKMLQSWGGGEGVPYSGFTPLHTHALSHRYEMLTVGPLPPPTPLALALLPTRPTKMLAQMWLHPSFPGNFRRES